MEFTERWVRTGSIGYKLTGGFRLAGRRNPRMVAGPMNRTGKLHALLSTARVANVPSVVSNVWVGVVLGTLTAADLGEQTAVGAPWILAVILAVAGVLLYVGGNFFNDWMDLRWDAEHRPERALPRGLFPPSGYLGLAVCLLAGGTGLAWAANSKSGWVATGIVLAITIYTGWHKRSKWTVVPMGLCRALLPVMGFLAIYPYLDRVWPVAGALFCYIIGLSLSARYESMKEPPKRVAVMARGLLLLAVLLVALGNRVLLLDRLPSVCSALPYLAWAGFCLRFWRQPVPKLVSGLLAGIPLLDWMVLLPVALTFMDDSREGIGSVAVVSAVVPPLAFISALLLQRLAPAT
jgi:4-hydroxybenzoate polyprenyltransferase